MVATWKRRTGLNIVTVLDYRGARIVLRFSASYCGFPAENNRRWNGIALQSRTWLESSVKSSHITKGMLCWDWSFSQFLNSPMAHKIMSEKYLSKNIQCSQHFVPGQASVKTWNVACLHGGHDRSGIISRSLYGVKNRYFFGPFSGQEWGAALLKAYFFFCNQTYFARAIPCNRT